jgi:hypothetical protein
MPLIDSTNKTIGLIVVMDRKAFDDVHWIEALMKILAVRTASELERYQKEHKLEFQLRLQETGLLMSSARSYIVIMKSYH